MEEKHNNRFNENCEKEFKFSEAVENSNDTDSKQYKRDFLLQLRLHPLSLQKPDNLPELEVVKNKLNLHNISDSSYESEDKNTGVNSFFPYSKSEYFSAKHDYPVMPSFCNRVVPSCYPPHVFGGSYSSTQSKYRLPANAYCNPFKKTSASSHRCYKDLGAEDCFHPKRYYPSSEDIWTCYPGSGTANFNKKMDDAEAVPKSRKKLSIIDPATGKNILETVKSSESLTDTETLCFDSEDYQSDSTENKHVGYYCIEETEHKNVAPSEGAIYSGTDIKSMSYERKVENKKSDEDNLNQPETADKSTANVKRDLASQDATKTSLNQSYDKIDDSPKTPEDSDPQKSFSKHLEELPTNDAKCQFDSSVGGPSNVKSAKCSYGPKESTPKQSEYIKEGLKQMKEKISTLKQEQQKMAILQSFLRYKKYQLEECARSLDEKRIEMANWECNLYNKTKRLLEKEQWLQNKNAMLYDKAIKLAQREKLLNGQDDFYVSSGPKNTSIKEFLDCDQDVSWGSSGSKNKYSRSKETGDNDHAFLHSNKLSHSSPVLSSSECKSVITSLDQLEKNIVMMEKIRATKDIGSSDIMPETVQSHSTANKNESKSSEPLGPSKGRRYLPDHIKYWLNKKEKNIGKIYKD